MAVSKRTRYLVLRRDNFCCRYCGLPAGVAQLHIDHVIPRAAGGTDDPSNLTAACADCNLGKTDHAPDYSLARAVWRDHADFMESRSSLVKRCSSCSRLFPIPGDRPPEDVTDCDDCEGLSYREWTRGFEYGMRKARGDL